MIMPAINMHRQISAKNLREGDLLVIGNSTYYVDGVTFTRDDEVKVSIGIGGTGTEFYGLNELVTIETAHLDVEPE